TYSIVHSSTSSSSKKCAVIFWRTTRIDSAFRSWCPRWQTDGGALRVMRIIFIYWAFEDQGSGLLIQGYTRAARELGHAIVVYGRAVPNIPLNYSTDIDGADAAVFIFEWTTNLLRGDRLDLLRLIDKVPRRRRVILDGDGNYNDIIRVDRDYNHADAESHR